MKCDKCKRKRNKNFWLFLGISIFSICAYYGVARLNEMYFQIGVFFMLLLIFIVQFIDTAEDK